MPTVALLPWGDVYEDFLDMIGISVEVFCREMTGGWLFNYADALRLSGMRSIIVIVSARASQPSRVPHAPTGTTICILPASKSYRAVRALLERIQRRFRRGGEEAARPFPGERRVLGPLSRVLREIAPYLATPLVPLARELRREGCGVILCQEYEYPRFDACVLLARLMRLPVFASFQGGDFRRGSLEQLVRALAIRASSGLVIGSRVEVERVRARYHVPLTKIAYIFNPFELSDWSNADRHTARKELGIPDSARVAVWHGRVSIRPKGLDILLDAWQRVVAARPGAAVRLVLVGTGSEAPQLHKKIDEQHIEGIVWIDRYVLDRALLRQYLAAGDVYVFPSRHEGFPVAAIEGMGLGLAIVAADGHGIRDILADGELSGGVVVPPEDPAALAATLGRALDEPAWTEKLGSRARARVKASFSLERVGSQLRAFFVACGANL